MERRLLLVFALTFLVIILFQPLLKKYLPQPPAPAPQTQAPVSTPAPSPAMAVQDRRPDCGAGKQAAAESETVVESDFYRITFTNRGAQVKSWILKKYDDDHRQASRSGQQSGGEIWVPLIAVDLR